MRLDIIFDKLFEYSLVGLRRKQLALKQLQRLYKGLLQAIYAKFDIILADVCPCLCSEVIELGLILLCRQISRAEVTQHISGEIQFGILVTTLADNEVELRQFVLFVLAIKQFNTII